MRTVCVFRPETPIVYRNYESCLYYLQRSSRHRIYTEVTCPPCMTPSESFKPCVLHVSVTLISWASEHAIRLYSGPRKSSFKGGSIHFVVDVWLYSFVFGGVVRQAIKIRITSGNSREDDTTEAIHVFRVCPAPIYMSTLVSFDATPHHLRRPRRR